MRRKTNNETPRRRTSYDRNETNQTKPEATRKCRTPHTHTQTHTQICQQPSRTWTWASLSLCLFHSHLWKPVIDVRFVSLILLPPSAAKHHTVVCICGHHLYSHIYSIKNCDWNVFDAFDSRHDTYHVIYHIQRANVCSSTIYVLTDAVCRWCKSDGAKERFDWGEIKKKHHRIEYGADIRQARQLIFPYFPYVFFVARCVCGVRIIQVKKRCLAIV